MKPAAPDVLELLPVGVLEQWFLLVDGDRSHLLPASRWLALGPRLFEILRQTPEPTHEQLTEFLRLLRRRAPGLAGFAEDLASESAAGRQALLELAVDDLLESDDWSHPGQVLPHPRPDYQQLLAVCSQRLQQARADSATRLAAVVFKVRRAARLAEEARQKQRRLRSRRA